MIPPSTALNPSRSLDRLLAEIQFLQSAARFRELPAPEVPEIAFAGRSNAGKSTALNVLVNRRRLAFASKTPGRTRLINLFALTDPEGEVGRLVDLPGYGYAAVDATTQRLWKTELSKYLGERRNLAGLILVTDIRHALGPLDQQMLAWFAPGGCPFMCFSPRPTSSTGRSKIEPCRRLPLFWMPIQVARRRSSGVTPASPASSEPARSKSWT